jgi:arginine decarboxylase
VVPHCVFLTNGIGVHKEKLESFEMALRDAQLAQYNLVPVSSIIPPHCKIVSRKKGIEMLSPGAITFVVMAKSETNEPNRLIAASVGMAVPADRRTYGYLSEHHAFGETDEMAGDYAEDLAATMLATTLGIDFDPNESWDARENVFKMSGKIVRTANVTQSAVGNKKGWWTTVVALAVFIVK